MGEMTAIPKNKRGMCTDQSKQLLNQAIDGSQAAFRQLVLTEHRKVRIYLSRYISCSSHVDDVAQEVFLAAYQSLATFRKQAKFSTWLLGIARNKALQFLRTEIRRRKNSERFADSALLNQRLTALCSDDFELEQQRIAALRECLSVLPQHAKGLVERYYYQQDSTAEIARHEDSREGAIRMKLFRIRKKLADCVSIRVANESI